MQKPPRLIRWISSVVVIFLLLLGFFRLFFYFWYRPAHYSFPADAFFMGLRLDLRVVGILGLLMLLLCAVPFINPFKNYGAKKFWNIILPLILLVVLFFYIVDFFHYDYLHQRLNASALNYLHDAGISLNMVWQTYPVIKSLLLIIVLVAVVAFLFSLLLRRFQRQPAMVSKRQKLWTIPFVVLLGIGVWGTLSQFALRWSDVFSLKEAFKAQLALNPLQSFASTLSFRNSTYDAQKAKENYALMANYLGVKVYDTTHLNYERDITPHGLIDSSQQPNVIVVICESFSAYKSSMWGNPLNATPFFDSLSGAGIFFDHCFTPSYGTARGVWGVITSIPDVEAPKTASRNPAIIDQNTIINAFTNYNKFYFLGGSASWANIRGLLKYNIEGLKLYEQEDYAADKLNVWGVSDKNLFLSADEIFAKQQKPFFAVIQSADNHPPYTIPDEDKNEFKKRTVSEDSLKKYGFKSNDEFNAFRYSDYCFKKFINAAQKQPYFKNTVFVFVGDHGIQGDANAMFPKVWTEQSLASHHVPLLFYSPLLQPARHSNFCSQTDVLPSVAGLLSRPFRNNSMGKNLFDSSLMKDSFRYSSAFVTEPDEHKIGMLAGDYYLRKTIGSPAFQLFSVVNNDPVPQGKVYDSVGQKLSRYTDAFFETTRYLLYNNKKK
jgi:phosphoglycerol transferase MdoB-like AlkP superfamily enzyme